MRSRRRFAKALVWAALLFTCAGPACDGPRKEEVPQTEAVAIPLESIYSTNGQEGVKQFGERQEERQDMNEVYRRSASMGASNLFLVRGKDIASAVRATLMILAGSRSADVPADSEDGKKGESLWLVAFLGTAGSAPPAWLVESVVVKGQTVQIKVSTPKRLAGTSDSHPYFVWAPLGELPAGMCTLELLSAEAGRLVLSRTVNVVESK